MASTDEPAFVERECLLFEAGDYPDRGVTITPDDLQAIAQNTTEVPVRVEHLARTPFDQALGVVTGFRVAGRQLFATLRQPVEAWRFIQKAGAKSLSIALDVAAKRIAEVSFVCSPRVSNARVFGTTSRPDGCVLLESAPLAPESGGRMEETEMTSVRQFAEGLMQYVRSALGAESFSDSEREQFAAERTAMQLERAERQVEDLKRKGFLRATDEAQTAAKAILQYGVTNVVQFGTEQVSLDRLFLRFLEANGPVIPLGEMVHGFDSSGAASDRLMALARDTARKEGLPYLTAFSRVSAAHPDLARAARDEGTNS